MTEGRTNAPRNDGRNTACKGDKVKVTLGELKSIEEGLIVDLCSVYDNKISLKVGGKLVAAGELVIINDRFGVRIENVNSSSNVNNETQDDYSSNITEEETQQEVNENTTNEEDFDYSDFEVEENSEE